MSVVTTPHRIDRTGRVGENVPRPDGIPKVTGDFAFSGDFRHAGMLWGGTLRSPYPSARILSVDVSRALAMTGVHAALTWEDVPGSLHYGLEYADQPVLADGVVRYQGEPVAVVAADHPDTSAEPSTPSSSTTGSSNPSSTQRSPRRPRPSIPTET